LSTPFICPTFFSCAGLDAAATKIMMKQANKTSVGLTNLREGCGIDSPSNPSGLYS
jgi:hypothetical protein